MEFFRIVLCSTLAAVTFGICHDLVTAHLCIEYFTVAHPFVLPSDNPIVMALIWGVLATWWVGLSLGTALGLAARLGGRPRRNAVHLLPEIGKLLMATALLALSLGTVGYVCSVMHWIWLVAPLSKQIPSEHHNFFFFDAFAHAGSYLGGFTGGIWLAYKTWKSRDPLVSG